MPHAPLAAALLLLAVAATGAAPAARRAPQPRPIGNIYAKGPPLVFAIPTYAGGIPEKVLPGRTTWRAGLPAVIVTDGPAERRVDGRTWDAPEHEAWFEFPDDNPGELHPDPTRPSDTRCIAVLRLANETHPEAHWYAYGDDDTQWFPEALLPLLRLQFDHTRPYILTDAWDPGCQPGKCRRERDTAVCVAGHARMNHSAGCVRFPAADPCTRQALSAPSLCEGYSYGISGSRMEYPVVCGSSGMLISRGLMDRISREEFMRVCEQGRDHEGGGGDRRLFACVWKLLGLGPTDPMFAGATGDDFCSFGFLRPLDLVTELRSAVEQGTCGSVCHGALHSTAAYSMSRVDDPAWAGDVVVRDVWEAWTAARALFVGGGRGRSAAHHLAEQQQQQREQEGPSAAGEG